MYFLSLRVFALSHGRSLTTHSHHGWGHIAGGANFMLAGPRMGRMEDANACPQQPA